jgi:hypothetical protein
MEHPMANAVSVMQPTNVSLEQRSKTACSILAQRTTTTQALRLAKDLVGNFPNLRPDNPGRFIESVDQVLGQYPLGIAQECADPIVGIASKVEFLSIKALIDWCEGRLSFYRALAAYVKPPEPRQIEPGPITAEQCENLMAKVAEVLRANTQRSPLDMLIDQRTKARRLRIEEIYRTAYGEAAE